MADAPPDAPPAWALWIRGLRGPQLQVLRPLDRGPDLTEHDKTRMLASPVLMRAGDETLPIAALARLYPPPAEGADP